LEVDVPTELIKYPCPKCGQYFEPFMHTSEGYACMECPDHGLFKTSVKVSKNFRIFCSKIARKPNRTQGYYTPGEQRIREFLLSQGLREGIDFIHNCRIKGEKSYYWADFYLPHLYLVIEYSPEVWHKMWGRKESDQRKREFLESNGLRIIDLGDKDLKNLEKILREVLRC
jgi:very-short-patch-repair endonuclease